MHCLYSWISSLTFLNSWSNVKLRMVEMVISTMRMTTITMRYLFRLRSRVENLFLVIFELREILVWVPAYTQQANTCPVFFRTVPASSKLSLDREQAWSAELTQYQMT